MSSLVSVSEFQQTVLGFYKNEGRDLPWRKSDANGAFDPYKILVSEIMLQQTQVNRVVPKYQEFIQRFPTIDALASAPLAEVLTLWSGLGYNRRAVFLHSTSQQINAYDTFPSSIDELIKLPGIGVNTANAIVAYAFNQPVIFIETNIRTVYIHHFFSEATGVTDAQLMPFIRRSLYADNPRKWYWALMDYGTFLKSKYGNVSQRSKHFIKQSKFSGSRRQIRGLILKMLVQRNYEYHILKQKLNDERTDSVLDELTKEGLISKYQQTYRLGK